MNPFARREAAFTTRPVHRQIGECFQVHFNTRLGVVEKCHMAPLARIEVGAQQGVDMTQQILVERSSYALRVVLGRHQGLHVLHQIDADNEGRPLPQQAPRALQKDQRFVSREVADG